MNEFPVTVIESANDRITFALGELASDAAEIHHHACILNEMYALLLAHVLASASAEHARSPTLP